MVYSSYTPPQVVLKPVKAKPGERTTMADIDAEYDLKIQQARERESKKMQTVFKYGLPMTSPAVISMPQGYQILSVGNQGDDPYVWAEVNPSAPLVDVHFALVGTGHTIPESDSREFVGTVFLHQERLVIHVYRLGFIYGD